MQPAFWEQVVADGFEVPAGADLTELTAELTLLLGSPDPHLRDLAARVLATWTRRGTYDDLLSGLGDGLAAGLRVGVGEDGTDTVFRRSYSAHTLGACLERDLEVSLAGPDTVLRWGDELLGWLVHERDLRGFVPGRGWAHAVAHGADALAALAASPVLGEPELSALLDVVADRLTEPTDHRLVHGEDDRLARAVMAVLRRDLVGTGTFDSWLDRLAEACDLHDSDGGRLAHAGNTQTFLRALHLQLAVGTRPPAARSDLLLSTLGVLTRTNAAVLS